MRPDGGLSARTVFGLSRRSRRVFAIVAGYRGGVAAETGLRDRIARARAGRPATGRRVRRWVALLGSLTVATTRICLRYRVTGLAAEAGFFALLSLPPLVLGLVGSIGFVGTHLGSEVVEDLRGQLRQITLTFLTADSVSKVILPTFDQVVGAGRADVVSIGFLLSLWSGSRVLNVYVDTISIMYGLGGYRGIVRTRALSFSMYVAALLVGIVLLPLVLIGPTLLTRFFDELDWGFLASVGWTGTLYWTIVPILAITGLAGLYHIATPVRSPWVRDLPGAALALVIWILSSILLRIVISASVGGASIYGPLATPIVVLIWLYFLAIAVLIGAALNAAIDERFPTPARVAARSARGPYAVEQPMTPVRDVHEDRVEFEP
jgi:membrane protein